MLAIALEAGPAEAALACRVRYVARAASRAATSARSSLTLRWASGAASAALSSASGANPPRRASWVRCISISGWMAGAWRGSARIVASSAARVREMSSNAAVMAGSGAASDSELGCWVGRLVGVAFGVDPGPGEIELQAASAAATSARARLRRPNRLTGRSAEPAPWVGDTSRR